MNRTLTYRQHLKSVKDKIKTRNNIIAKLAGTSWGCHANVLRTSALALVYSVAEYCVPVWARSAHLQEGRCTAERHHENYNRHREVYSIRMVAGPIQYSPPPPRQVQTELMLLKLINYPDLPIQIDSKLST